MPPFAPTLANPFTGFILPGAGASGINIIDSHLQSPIVHEFHLGIERDVRGDAPARRRACTTSGGDFLIGRTVGEVFNPVVGGPDRVVNIESSAETQYDALLLSVERPIPAATSSALAYTLAKAFNYANDDQIPFLNGPIDPNDLRREYGPTPNDRRHRFVASGQSAAARRRRTSAPVDDLVGRADGHHDAGRPDARPGDAAQRRRAAVQDRRRAQCVSSRS